MVQPQDASAAINKKVGSNMSFGPETVTQLPTSVEHKVGLLKVGGWWHGVVVNAFQLK